MQCSTSRSTFVTSDRPSASLSPLAYKLHALSQTAAVLRVNSLLADILIRCCRQILEEAVPEAVEAAEAVLRREHRREREVRSLGLAAGAGGGFGRCAPALLPLS